MKQSDAFTESLAGEFIESPRHERRSGALCPPTPQHVNQFAGAAVVDPVAYPAQPGNLVVEGDLFISYAKGQPPFEPLNSNVVTTISLKPGIWEITLAASALNDGANRFYLTLSWAEWVLPPGNGIPFSNDWQGEKTVRNFGPTPYPYRALEDLSDCPGGFNRRYTGLGNCGLKFIIVVDGIRLFSGTVGYRVDISGRRIRGFI